MAYYKLKIPPLGRNDNVLVIIRGVVSKCKYHKVTQGINTKLHYVNISLLILCDLTLSNFVLQIKTFDTASPLPQKPLKMASHFDQREKSLAYDQRKKSHKYH